MRANTETMSLVIRVASVYRVAYFQRHLEAEEFAASQDARSLALRSADSTVTLMPTTEGRAEGRCGGCRIKEAPFPSPLAPRSSGFRSQADYRVVVINHWSPRSPARVSGIARRRCFSVSWKIRGGDCRRAESGFQLASIGFPVSHVGSILHSSCSILITLMPSNPRNLISERDSRTG